jgi:hypothetical protein
VKILTLSSHLRPDLPGGLFPSDFHTKALYSLLFPYVLHASPSPLKPFSYVNDIKDGGAVGVVQKPEATERVVFCSAGPADRGLGRTLLYKNLEKQNGELRAGRSCSRWRPLAGC